MAAPSGRAGALRSWSRSFAGIGATSTVRLACQLRPRGAVEVTPLLPPFAHAADGRREIDLVQGSEREIAILFADIRGFTALSEGRLPYDVVFVLNRYFAAMGRAVEAVGGHVDKFIGDGIMALFGIERGAQAGCRDALAAARLMSARLDELNASLRAELDRPLRIGIGIHCGPTIVGEMGYGNVAAITAIGDAVNTASRLESLTKNFACELVVSEETASRAGLDLSAFPQREVEIRGKREVLAIRTLASAGELPVTDGVLIHRAAANNTLRPEAPCRADSAGSG
jgi:adenylate cyclase